MSCFPAFLPARETLPSKLHGKSTVALETLSRLPDMEAVPS